MEIFLLLITILFLGFLLVRKKYNYWADRGVPFLKPNIPFGYAKGVGTKVTIAERHMEIYNEMKSAKSPIAGVYFFLTPQAFVTDLDILRNILVKDFAYFQNRSVTSNEKKDPLSATLLALEGDKWKNMRAKVSPTFTSGKMKMMHSTLVDVAEQFKDSLRSVIAKNDEVEIKELLAQMTTDIIGNVAFGIECNSIKDPNSEFRNKGRALFAVNPWLAIRRMFVINMPFLVKLFNLRVFPKEITEFFLRIVKETAEYREKNQIVRNDFMQLLLQIKNTGTLEDHATNLGTLSIEQVAAQTFIFFVAGFETSSSTMTFATYELAMHQDIQDRAREEVNEVLNKYNGELTYEAAMEMTYLDQVINETLRKYPIAAVAVRRKVEKDYKVPNTNIVLEAGTVLQVPVLGIHRDPEIYPEPDKFDPERFTKENIAARHPFAFLPFGDGPRNCIGLRFGMMETRIGLATILKNFKLLPSAKTPVNMVFQPSSPVLSPKGGMYLKIKAL